MKNKLIIDEIFYSIQGEGYYVGEPSIFIRLSLCNLVCSWCDTNAWKRPGEYTAFNNYQMEPQEVANNIFNIISKNNLKFMPHLVFTGGEPMIQQTLINEVIGIIEDGQRSLMDGEEIFSTIETNGTIAPSGQLDWGGNVTFSVSPKLKNSDNSLKDRRKDKAMMALVDSQSYFKFVVTSESHKEDLEEIKTIRKLYDISEKDIYLMPEGKTAKELEKNRELIISLCLKEGYKFSDRVQVIIWGNKRGT